MTHDGCALDAPDRAIAVASVRGWRLTLASLRDDEDASDRTLAEVEDCPACLRALVRWLAGSTSSAFVSIAHGSRDAAIRQSERLLHDRLAEDLRGFALEHGCLFRPSDPEADALSLKTAAM
ncbi:hypothetical protein A9W94_16870 [Mycobacterium asiaticum]|nr:hypothetical protein A9W94_16870 [Mycobacterium asiaticum]